MFDLIQNLMLSALEAIKSVVGNYGWAIIGLTVLVRAVLWPVSQSQMKSMRQMQLLQPRMKMLQDRYKTEPQKLQGEMLKLYKDHKFNPLGGCLPMLVQLPLFIGLYWAISSPLFMAGQDPIFLNFIHLKHTGIISHAGPSGDDRMSLAEKPGGGFLGFGKDHLMPGAKMTVTLNNGKVLHDQPVPDPKKAVHFFPEEPRAELPVKLVASYSALKLDGLEGLVKDVEMPIQNSATKETENVHFVPATNGKAVVAQLQTEAGKDVPHYDVLLLVLIFAGTMLLSQKLMSAQSSSTANAQQQQMMKFMPLMFSAFLFVFPIPAGVLLYMDTNSLFQVFQTWWFQRNADADTSPPSQAVVDVSPSGSSS